MVHLEIRDFSPEDLFPVRESSECYFFGVQDEPEPRTESSLAISAGKVTVTSDADSCEYSRRSNVSAVEFGGV